MRNGLKICRPTGSPAIAVAGSGSQTASIVGQGSVEFGNASTLSLNNVFTSDYDNYLINLRFTASSTNLSFYYRLRSAGVDADGGNYTNQYIAASAASVTALRSVSQTAGQLANANDAQRCGETLHLYGPALSQPTAFRSTTANSQNDAIIVDFASTHSLSTAYDGITLFVASGSITGMITVYGLVD